MKITPENITELGPNEIFVFGSNLAGRHGAGAAKLALEKFGAIWGKGTGLAGQSYAIPTKDHYLHTMPLKHIEGYVTWFLEVAAVTYPEKHFLVTAIGCGLAGYAPRDIAPLFLRSTIPDNVSLPASFYEKLD